MRQGYGGVQVRHVRRGIERARRRTCLRRRALHAQMQGMQRGRSEVLVLEAVICDVFTVEHLVSMHQPSTRTLSERSIMERRSDMVETGQTSAPSLRRTLRQEPQT